MTYARKLVALLVLGVTLAFATSSAFAQEGVAPVPPATGGTITIDGPDHEHNVDNE